MESLPGTWFQRFFNEQKKPQAVCGIQSCTGMCVLDTPHGGDYKVLGLICEGDRSGTSFSAQFTSGFKIGGQYIVCADHRMPQWWEKLLGKQLTDEVFRHFKDYRPDFSPKKQITSISR